MGMLKDIFSKSVKGPDGEVGDVMLDDGDYQAAFGEFKATGDSPAEAIGNLMIQYGKELGFPVDNEADGDEMPVEEKKSYAMEPYPMVVRPIQEAFVNPSEQNLLVKALEALARQPDQHTHIHLPDNMKMDIPVPIVNVTVPEQTLTVNIPEQPAPVVNVEVKAPDVNVAAPEVTVIVPPPVPMKKTVTKTDADGNPTEITETPI